MLTVKHVCISPQACTYVHIKERWERIIDLKDGVAHVTFMCVA